jgi:methyl-accepting chemotaxis protein
MIGIYKIISPKNKVYIGQSIDIEKRFYNYRLGNCYSQIRLNRSLNKYGYENHIFEIIEECDITLLNERERYYQDLYNAVGKQGLNCRLTKSNDKSGRLSKETISKMIEAQKKNIKKLSSKSKKVINTKTKEIYNSVKELSDILNVSPSNLSRKLKGTRKNKTIYKYLEDDINECNKIIKNIN